MKKLFNIYMELPMSVMVVGAIVTWATLASIVLTPAILIYVLAWCLVLIPFLSAVAYTERRHKIKVDYQTFLKEVREEMGEN